MGKSGLVAPGGVVRRLERVFAKLGVGRRVVSVSSGEDEAETWLGCGGTGTRL